MDTANAVGHKVFIGKLDKQELGLAEKLVVWMVKAPSGDFRDWQVVASWAGEIVKALSPAPIPT
jgi:menaquinone-dependent protoporphyrinogen oxidase